MYGHYQSYCIFSPKADAYLQSTEGITVELNLVTAVRVATPYCLQHHYESDSIFITDCVYLVIGFMLYMCI